MLKKLTSKGRSQKKTNFRERIACGCYNMCVAECYMGPMADATANFDIKVYH